VITRVKLAIKEKRQEKGEEKKDAWKGVESEIALRKRRGGKEQRRRGVGDRNKTVFSRSGVEINFSDVNIMTEVEHFLPREQIFANTCSLGSFHFFDSCDKNLMGVFIFFECCDKNLIVLSRQLLIPLNSSKDDNSFVIIFLFLKFEIFVLFLLPTVKKIVYILLERMLIFPSVLCSPRASPSGYKLHLRKNHAFLSLNI
jgi:hypothetical protein